MQPGVLKRFWAVCREYGLSSEEAHDLVLTNMGTEHISELRDSEALYIIDIIQGKKQRKPQTNGKMISDKQLYLINRLSCELGWDDNPARLTGFVRKYTGVDNLTWLTAKQASSVIEGLKRIQRGASVQK